MLAQDFACFYQQDFWGGGFLVFDSREFIKEV